MFYLRQGYVPFYVWMENENNAYLFQLHSIIPTILHNIKQISLQKSTVIKMNLIIRKMITIHFST